MSVDWNYDIKALLRSEQAKKSRKYIADGNCACPLANQWLNNILVTPRHMLRVLFTSFFVFGQSPRKVKASPPQKGVRPQEIEVKILGTILRKALVLHKFGTIPEEEEVELPQFVKPPR